MTWKRAPDVKCFGKALSPNVRANWRADSKLGSNCPETDESRSRESSKSDKE